MEDKIDKLLKEKLKEYISECKKFSQMILNHITIDENVDDSKSNTFSRKKKEIYIYCHNNKYTIKVTEELVRFYSELYLNWLNGDSKKETKVYQNLKYEFEFLHNTKTKYKLKQRIFEHVLTHKGFCSAYNAKRSALFNNYFEIWYDYETGKFFKQKEDIKKWEKSCVTLHGAIEPFDKLFLDNRLTGYQFVCKYKDEIYIKSEKGNLERINKIDSEKIKKISQIIENKKSSSILRMENKHYLAIIKKGETNVKIYKITRKDIVLIKIIDASIFENPVISNEQNKVFKIDNYGFDFEEKNYKGTIFYSPLTNQLVKTQQKSLKSKYEKNTETSFLYLKDYEIKEFHSNIPIKSIRSNFLEELILEKRNRDYIFRLNDGFSQVYINGNFYYISNNHKLLIGNKKKVYKNLINNIPILEVETNKYYIKERI